jgi:hypothetical protein
MGVWCKHHSRQVEPKKLIKCVLSFCKKLVGRPQRYIFGVFQQVSYRMTEELSALT